MKDKIINPLLLLLTAIIWGSGFVAQSVGMNFVQPFTFNFSRCIVGGIFLAIYIMVMGKGSKKSKKSIYWRIVLWIMPFWWDDISTDRNSIY